jgi:hypothetical protein
VQHWETYFEFGQENFIFTGFQIYVSLTISNLFLILLCCCHNMTASDFSICWQSFNTTDRKANRWTHPKPVELTITFFILTP